MKHCSLRGTPCATVGLGGVLAVLDDVEIEASEIHYAEVVHALIDLVELVTVVGRDDLSLNVFGPLEQPTVQRQHVGRLERMLDRVKSREVGEQEA